MQFVALFSLGRIWEIYTKYIFLMSYWLEERTELALGTIRCSHPPLHPQMMEQSGSCLLPELQVFVCSWMYIPITLSAATNEDGCVLSVWHPLGASQCSVRLDIDGMVEDHYEIHLSIYSNGCRCCATLWSHKIRMKSNKGAWDEFFYVPY